MAVRKEVKKRDVRITHWLIDQGAAFDLQDNDGWTALMFACRNNQPETAKLLIEKGAALDLQNNNGWTALMLACRYDQPEPAKLLVEKGAALDLQDNDGWTALMLACQLPEETQHTKAGLLRCIQICYAAGARTDCRTSDTGSDALALARCFKREDAVAFLEFVLESDLSQIVLKELGIGRRVLVSLYNENVRSVAVCKELCELGSAADLDKLGFASSFETKRFVKRFNAAALKRPSLFRNERKVVEYAGFLSHYKAEAGTTARIVELMMKQKSLGNKVFLDSNNLSDLYKLLDQVRASKAVIILLRNCFTRPWGIVELVAAYMAKPRIPFTAVGLVGVNAEFDPAQFKMILKTMRVYSIHVGEKLY